MARICVDEYGTKKNYCDYCGREIDTLSGMMYIRVIKKLTPTDEPGKGISDKIFCDKTCMMSYISKEL